MLARDIEMFIEHCGLKGLSTKTINSYEQTLKLFMQYMDEQGILLTEKITHLAIQGYIKSIKERGKYTVTTNPNSGNYPDRRVDFGKRVSDITINNYLRNLRVFFNWCVEEELILRSPVKKGDFVKVERKPLEFVSDEDFKRLLKSMNSASFSEYRDSIIIQLLLDTGMRVNECLLIEVTDLDMVKRCISLPADNTKGKKARYVFFSDKMATQLQRWIKYKDRYITKYRYYELKNFCLQYPDWKKALEQVNGWESSSHEVSGIIRGSLPESSTERQAMIRAYYSMHIDIIDRCVAKLEPAIAPYVLLLVPSSIPWSLLMRKSISWTINVLNVKMVSRS